MGPGQHRPSELSVCDVGLDKICCGTLCCGVLLIYLGKLLLDVADLLREVVCWRVVDLGGRMWLGAADVLR